MEEGVFRGLFIKLAKERYSFNKANLIAAILFGLWHFVMPLRSYIDNEMSFQEMLVMGIGYVILAGIMSIKWGMLIEMTGTIWVGLAEHFFNNTIINALHVVTVSGSDEMQIARVMIACTVVVVYIDICNV